MSVLAVADSVAVDTLRAAVERASAGRWPVDAFETERGAAAVAGAPTWRAGDWLVAGMPVRDPWGVPGGEPYGPALAAAFDRYGPAAVQLATGPFSAVDLGYGTVVRALNGIVPFYAASQGDRVASTSVEVLAAISSGGPVRRLAPGAALSPDAESSWGPISPDPVAAAATPWAWLDGEINRRVGTLGPLSQFRGERDLWCTPRDYAIYLPRLTKEHLQPDVLPRLWWAARLAGRWLHAPAFERPVLDTVAMLRTGRFAREQAPE